MSTSAETDQVSCWPPARVTLLVPPEMASPLKDALSEVGFDAVIGREWPSAGGCEFDLIVCDPASLRAAPESDAHRAPQHRPEPLLIVVVGARDSEREELLDRGADLVIGGDNEAEATARQLAALVRRLRLERDRNPLTGLAGNRRLQEHLQGLLHEGRSIGLLLLDIDRFKQFNDRHGHLTGDAAIEMLAECAVEAASRHEDCLVTHVGGDDFCIVTAPEGLEPLARRVQSEFERRAAGLSLDDGEDSPTLTAVATTVEGERGVDLATTFRGLAALKETAKEQPGSTYICQDTGTRR